MLSTSIINVDNTQTIDDFGIYFLVCRCDSKLIVVINFTQILACISTPPLPLPPPRQCILMWFQYPLTLSKPGSSLNFLASRSTTSPTGRIILVAWCILPWSLCLLRDAKYSGVLHVDWRVTCVLTPILACLLTPRFKLHEGSEEEEGTRWFPVTCSLLHLLSLFHPHFDRARQLRAQLLRLTFHYCLALTSLPQPAHRQPATPFGKYILMVIHVLTQRVLRWSYRIHTVATLPLPCLRVT